MKALAKQPRCIVIAGPNGAGKTTFARQFLPKSEGVTHFVNADLIAGGLSPLRPEIAAAAAGRIFLAELDRWANVREDFAFETTLSSQTHLGRLRRWKSSGYRIEIAFLRLASPQIAIRRIAERVRQGGHNVPWEMCSAVLNAAGRTSALFTDLWPTVRQSTTIRVNARN